MLRIGEDTTVRITHFINPHCFWYKTETAYLPHYEQRKFLDEFNEYSERELVRRSQQADRAWYKRIEGPGVGDLVAQHNTDLQRWIRCEVDDIFVDVGGVVWYQLWAMDEGLPIKSLKEHILPLPEAYSSQPAHAQRGALRNILPGKTRYDYVRGRNIETPCSSWCPGIVSTLLTLLDDALSVFIVEYAHIAIDKGVVHFGDIFLRTHHNKSFNVVDLLCQACPDQLILCPDVDFFNAVQFSATTLNMVRYQNNEGIDNAPRKLSSDKGRQAETRGHALLESHNAIKAQADPNVQYKVGDWFSRNMRAISEVGKITDHCYYQKTIPSLAVANIVELAKDNNVQNPTSYSQLETIQREKEYDEPCVTIRQSAETINRVEIDPDESNACEEIAIIGTAEPQASEEKISSLLTKIKHHQARRQQSRAQKEAATAAPQQLVGPAGCSLRHLLINAKDREQEKTVE